MAATVTVSQVRQALQRANGLTPGDGQPSSAALGTVFHRVIAELLRPDSESSIETVLRDCDPDVAGWKSRLQAHAYDRLLGPLLTQQAGLLQGQGTQVLGLWQALRSACDWFADLWWEFTGGGRTSADQRVWIGAEQPLVRELNRPGWREPVALLGQADAILRVPTRSAYCVLEWKLGQTSPTLDLAQAALYHLILGGDRTTAGRSALAVMSFKPDRSEFTVEGSRLEEAQKRLIELIGQVAGVASPTPAALKPGSVPAPVPASTRVSPAVDRIQVDVPIASSPPASAEAPPWIGEKQTLLLRTLRQSGAACRESGPPVLGPTFARFFVFPERGVTVKKVISQAEQLFLHLGLPSPPGMSVLEGRIGIDLPRPDRQTLSYAELSPHLPTPDRLTGSSRVPVGVDLGGTWHFLDLASSESAHALVVGTPGSGKSQWLRVAVAALMATNRPETLKLLLIDPKQNAFPFVSGSPFLLRSTVIPGREETPIGETLHVLTEEMNRRNGLLAASQSQSLDEHVRKTGQSLSRIVCVCDEYADLLDGSDTRERKEIEHEFKRIAQVGRAAGIHLILATQQPRANVLTPGIRALIPAKVCLRVSSGAESRLALESNGAERLLGNGDLLYRCIGEPVRLQGAWLPPEQEPRSVPVHA